MPKILEKVFAWTVGVIALAAVTFGLAVATAKPVEASSCQYDGINFMGQQPSDNACFAACFAVHGGSLEDWDWVPSTGCCRCFY